MSSVPVRYSQNFLRDPRLVDHLLSLSSLDPEDTVVEIGPGAGIITDRLARRCRQVIAIEKDRQLAMRLQCRYRDQPHIAIHAADFLDFPLPEQPYTVFANIPFALTQAIMTKLTSGHSAPDDAYLIMQREAALKFCGQPREYLYSALLEPWFDLDILYHFRRGDFIPSPRVDVVMLRMRKRGPPLVAARDRQRYRDFVVYGFVTRQPTLAHILRPIFTHRQLRQIAHLSQLDLDAGPSAVTFTQWLQLFEYFQRYSDPPARQIVAGSERRLRAQQGQLQKVHRTRMARRE